MGKGQRVQTGSNSGLRLHLKFMIKLQIEIEEKENEKMVIGAGRTPEMGTYVEELAVSVLLKNIKSIFSEEAINDLIKQKTN